MIRINTYCIYFRKNKENVMSIPTIKARLESEFNILSGSNTTLICTCRHWGNWQIPDDVDQEDYDNEELTEKSYNKLQSIIVDLNKEFPKHGIDYMFSENNYIELTVIEV